MHSSIAAPTAQTTKSESRDQAARGPLQPLVPAAECRDTVAEPLASRVPSKRIAPHADTRSDIDASWLACRGADYAPRLRSSPRMAQESLVSSSFTSLLAVGLWLGPRAATLRSCCPVPVSKQELDESTRNLIDGCPFVLSVCIQASWKEGNRGHLQSECQRQA